MGNRMDLVGKKFTRLTVISEIDKPLPRYFLCKCDCGEETTVRMSSLRNGTVKSCGCLRTERAIETKTLDLANRKFGKLTAIAIIGKHKKNVNLWECLCDCGEMITTRTDHLMSGDVQSCGCLKKEVETINLRESMAEKTVDGVRVPLLTQKIRTDNKSGHKGVTWAKREKRWRVTIRINGKSVHLGYFNDINLAIAARLAAEEIYHRPYINKLKEGKNNVE